MQHASDEGSTSMASTCDQELAEIVKKLFPECHEDVVHSISLYDPYTLVECARANMDQKERMALFLAAAARVAELQGTEIDVGLGVEYLRDPTSRCEVFAYGQASGDCKTDGHYLCSECKERDPELIRDSASPYYVPPMERRKHKAQW